MYVTRGRGRVCQAHVGSWNYEKLRVAESSRAVRRSRWVAVHSEASCRSRASTEIDAPHGGALFSALPLCIHIRPPLHIRSVAFARCWIVPSALIWRAVNASYLANGRHKRGPVRTSSLGFTERNRSEENREKFARALMRISKSVYDACESRTESADENRTCEWVVI